MVTKTISKTVEFCNFCGKKHEDLKPKLLLKSEHSDTHICEDCVNDSVKIIAQKRRKK